MNPLVRFSSRIKYLGLLGLPSLFLDAAIFDFLWLFWLFGFVEISYNFPIFVQSLKQIWGILIISFRYSSHLPDVNNYRCKAKYSLPFTGNWTVVNGGVEKESSHSWDIPTQRYAYDFLILDPEGKSCPGDVRKTVDYYCYGKEILAPADGEVIEAFSHYPDSRISGNGEADCSAPDIRGNYILIRHTEDEYSLLAHLQPGSVKVKAGEAVKQGQIIACCGNSGNSSEPHLHFQLQHGTSFFSSPGLPIEFEKISASPAPNYSAFDPRPVPAVIGLAEKYIARGQNVSNISN